MPGIGRATSESLSTSRRVTLLAKARLRRARGSRRTVVKRLTVAVVAPLASALALLGASVAPTAGGG